MSGTTVNNSFSSGSIGTLVSPGVLVSIIDESQYVSTPPGTVPLFIIATQANKPSPTPGAGIAPQTVPSEAGQLYLATSQRDLIQSFGNPFFYEIQGTPVNGYELNEYGLWAAYSYLGISNQAYVLRADLDLAQLFPTTTAPSSPPTAGTYWLNLASTSWGVFRANGSTSPGAAWNLVTVLVPNSTQVNSSSPPVPLPTYGTLGNVAVVTESANNYLYENVQTSSFVASLTGTTLTVSSITSGIVSQISVGDLINGVGITTGTMVTALGSGSGGTGTYTVNSSTNSFIGSISGTTMTVTYITSGALAAGQAISGLNVDANTTIVSQLSGNTGSVGTYQVSNSQTVGSENMTAINNVSSESMTSSGWLKIGSSVWEAAHPTVLTGTTVSGTLTSGDTFTVNGTTITVANTSFTGSISSTTLNASAISSGVIGIGQTITGAGVTSNTSIVAYGTNSFTGSISGTTLTVSAVGAGSIGVGQVVSGTSFGVAANTVILAQTGGVAGGTGTYTVSISQTVSSQGLTTISVGGIGNYTVNNSQTVSSESLTGNPIFANIVSAINAASITNIVASLAVNGAVVVTNTAGTYITIANTSGTSLAALGLATSNAAFTASITGTSMVVSAVSSGTLAPGQAVIGTNIPAGTIITAYVTGSGGAGNYTINNSLTVTSESMTSTSVSGVYTVYNNSPTFPPGTSSYSLWIKGSPSNNGASWSVNYFNINLGTSGQWVLLNAPFYLFNSTLTDGNIAKDAAALAAIPSPVAGNIYIGYDPNTGDMQIRRWSGSEWQSLVYEAQVDAPTNPPVAGTLWYNTNFQVDIMYGNGENWIGYRHQFPETDPFGVQIDGSAPTTQSDGVTPLADGDLWVDSSNLENYPSIYRWSLTDLQWFLLDNTDNTSPNGIIFYDARNNSGTTFTGILNTGTYAFNSTNSNDMVMSDFVDPDAPDPRTYPAGMLLFNTRYSTYNVKSYQPLYFKPGGFSPTTDYTTTTYNVGNPNIYTFPALSTAAIWVTDSGNDPLGNPYIGRKAQRIEVVKSLQAQVTANQDIRSEIIFYNLVSAPGYPELLADLVSLNTDIKNIAFIVSDTPIRLASDATSIQNWATNAADVPMDGEDGLVTANPYAAVWYPWGLTNNLDGTEIMIPPSAIALVTIAYNDQVAFPWYAPAGFNRGLVTNATSVGYLNSGGEYVPTILNQGQRDTLYTNNINPIAYIPRRGLVVYGQKTLSPIASALDRINVARLINYIAYNLEIILKPYLFEQNIASTRAAAAATVSTFFNQIVGQNGLYDYSVVCDTSNNTPDRIDQNELWVDCAIQPVKDIEFIYVPVRILTTQATIG